MLNDIIRNVISSILTVKNRPNKINDNLDNNINANGPVIVNNNINITINYYDNCNGVN